MFDSYSVIWCCLFINSYNSASVILPRYLRTCGVRLESRFLTLGNNAPSQLAQRSFLCLDGQSRTLAFRQLQGRSQFSQYLGHINNEIVLCFTNGLFRLTLEGCSCCAGSACGDVAVWVGCLLLFSCYVGARWSALMVWFGPAMRLLFWRAPDTKYPRVCYKRVLETWYSLYRPLGRLSQ